MGLAVLRADNGRIAPAMVCDTCGERIEDWKLAMAAFNGDFEGEVAAVRVYHKGGCDPGNRSTLASAWHELSTYVPWLLWNHGWGDKAVEDDESSITVAVPEPLS